MTSAPPDPPRLFGDDDALGQALRDARADLPGDRQLAALAAGLGPLLPPLGPGGPGDGGAGSAGDGAMPPPLALPPEALVPLAPLPLAPLVTGKVAAVFVAASLAIGAPFAYQATRPAPLPVASATTVDSTSTLSIPVPVEPVAAATTTAAPSASAAPSARAAVSVRATGGAASEGAVEDVAPQETEGQLLRRAHDALGSDPLRALALTDDHVRTFPGGMLGQERELVAIEALTKLGRVGQARVRGASFLQRFPTSAHARRVRTLVPGLEGMGEEPK